MIPRRMNVSSRCREDEEGRSESISRSFAREILYCRRWNWKARENQVEEYRSSAELSNRVKINDNHRGNHNFPRPFDDHFTMEMLLLSSRCKFRKYNFYPSFRRIVSSFHRLERFYYLFLEKDLGHFENISSNIPYSISISIPLKTCRKYTKKSLIFVMAWILPPNFPTFPREWRINDGGSSEWASSYRRGFTP